MKPQRNRTTYVNCAVRERTSDGTPVGRCWFYVGGDDVCPRHGDVSKAQRHYCMTGELSEDLREEGEEKKT